MALSKTRWTWIDHARAGDQAAVRALFQKYRPAVVGWFSRRVSAADAEDLAQEVFLRLFDKALADAEPGKGRFRSLVFAIARNVLGGEQRKRLAQKRGGGAEPAPLEHEVAAPAEDEDFDREWIANLIELGLQRLEREHASYHQALLRCAVQGEPQTDLADELGCSVQVIKNRVSRGRKKLNAYLREEVWTYSTSQEEYSVELERLTRLLPD